MNDFDVDEVLSALGERLNRAGERIELVVVGGSGLLALGLIDRSADELIAAARWTTTHDPSEGFRHELLGALAYLGVESADLGA